METWRPRARFCSRAVVVDSFAFPGKTVPAVPVPRSVPGKTVPTVPVSGSGSVPGPHPASYLGHQWEPVGSEDVSAEGRGDGAAWRQKSLHNRRIHPPQCPRLQLLQHTIHSVEDIGVGNWCLVGKGLYMKGSISKASYSLERVPRMWENKHKRPSSRDCRDQRSFR